MHTVTIRVPTYEKDYDNFCDYLTNQCHAHGTYIDEQQIDYIDKQKIDNIPCPINAFCCPFDYKSCSFVKPDDWFKVIVIDPKPWD